MRVYYYENELEDEFSSASIKAKKIDAVVQQIEKGNIMTDNKSGEILIIEDDKDINDLLATALSKAGYRTRQAWSGTEGELLLKLDREAYALVLLDLMLPGLSGEQR